MGDWETVIKMLQKLIFVIGLTVTGSNQVFGQTNLALSIYGTRCECDCLWGACPEIIDGVSNSQYELHRKEFAPKVETARLSILFNATHRVGHIRLMEGYYAQNKILKRLIMGFANGGFQQVVLPERRRDGYLWNEIPVQPVTTNFVEIILNSTYVTNPNSALITEIEIYEENPGYSPDVCPWVQCASENDGSSDNPIPTVKATPATACPEVTTIRCQTCPTPASVDEMCSPAVCNCPSCPSGGTEDSAQEPDQPVPTEPVPSEPVPSPQCDCTSDDVTDKFLFPFVAMLCAFCCCLVVIAFLLVKICKPGKKEPTYEIPPALGVLNAPIYDPRPGMKWDNLPPSYQPTSFTAQQVPAVSPVPGTMHDQMQYMSTPPHPARHVSPQAPFVPPPTPATQPPLPAARPEAPDVYDRPTSYYTDATSTNYIEVDGNLLSDKPDKPSIPVVQPGESNAPMTQPAESNVPVTRHGESNAPMVQSGESNLPVTRPGESNAPMVQSGESNVPVVRPGESNAPMAQSGESNVPVARPGESNAPIAQSTTSTAAGDKPDESTILKDEGEAPAVMREKPGQSDPEKRRSSSYLSPVCG